LSLFPVLAMFSWMSKEENRRRHTDVYDNVTVGLQNVYKKNLLPLEREYNFHDFHRCQFNLEKIKYLLRDK